jgi:hypothetical protein
MDYEAFLERVVDDGIAAARADYADDDPKREGSVAGFEACRGESPGGLAALLKGARRATARAFQVQAPDYWHGRCYEAEVEWVCKCVCAAFRCPELTGAVAVTTRAAMKAAHVFAACN